MEQKEKKRRTPKIVCVEWSDGTGEPCALDFHNVSEAERWLKKNGEDGGTYRIVTVEREVTMKVESRRVASFE